MTREADSEQRTLETQTRTVRWVSLALAVAGFGMALLIAYHPGA